MASIPNIINFIWLGSYLRKNHEKRLSIWKSINKSHQVNLWIDKSLISTLELHQLQEFSQQHDIQLKDVKSLCFEHLPEIRGWLLEISKDEARNYGALSAIYPCSFKMIAFLRNEIILLCIKRLKSTEAEKEKLELT